MLRFPALVLACLLPLGAQAAPDTAPRPQGRITLAQADGSTAGLEHWIIHFRARAISKGIEAATLNSVLRNLTYDRDIIRRDRNQSEFTKTIWDYLDTAASDLRVKNGQAALRKHETLLSEIETLYGVDRHIVVAIWGLESSYGAFRGSQPVIQSLATLAYDGRRGDFFEEQLIAALRILQTGDTTAQNMTGSWAGAMGHTQFIPTSYLDYVVDFRGDGARDIWSDDPTDALASTAAYLKAFGWTTGQPWGVEVTLPSDFDYLNANRDIEKLPSVWAEMGVTGTEGRAVPDHGSATILLPGGASGAAFMIFGNFETLERYNTADAYVIGVGHLADRLRGGPVIQSNWPRDDRALTGDERRELQRRLTDAGFDTQGIDARIGPLTINAIRQYQLSIEQTPDGYAPPRLLERLRQN